VVAGDFARSRDGAALDGTKESRPTVDTVMRHPLHMILLQVAEEAVQQLRRA
jgi:hypothetical protein